MLEPGKLELGNRSKITRAEGYKPSRFNVRAEDKNGDLLLLNTYSSKFIKVVGEQIPIIENILRNPDDSNQEHKLFNELISRGFLVRKDTDEFKRASLKHMKTIASEGALTLILLPNEDCNFRCKYCYESFEKNFMKDWVQRGVVEFVKKNIKKYTSVHISWFGGEPLTAIPIVERVSKELLTICQEHKVPYTSSMTTNGYNLTLEVFKKMSACRISSYQITLDGTAVTHDKTRVRANGKGTFDQITKNLIAIRDNIKSSSFQITIRANVTKEVLNNIDAYTEFLKKEFSSDSRFKTHWHRTGNWGGESVKDIESTFCTSKDVAKNILKAAHEGVDFSNYQNMLSDAVCYAAKQNNFVIGSDGIIYKCTVAFDDDNNQVGMLTENGQMHIDIDKYSLWVTGHETVDSGCQKCFFRPACQGASCPLYRINTGNSPCPPLKDHIKDYMKAIAYKSNKIEKIDEVAGAYK